MSAYDKPTPRINPDNAPFWESAHEGALRLPRCGDCRAWHWPPGPVCPACFSDRIGWEETEELLRDAYAKLADAVQQPVA